MQLKRRGAILSQASIWSLVWLGFLFLLNKEGNYQADFWWNALRGILGVFVVVYVNLIVLIPRYYIKKNKIVYIFLSATLLFAVVSIIHSDRMPWNLKEEKYIAPESVISLEENDSDFRWLIRNLPPLFISLLGSSFVALTIYANKKESDALYLRESQLETELLFLKSQINPHFLFNTIHNIYALTVIQSEAAPEQLLRLSEILRYMLYDSNEDLVDLKREIENLQNYIGLAQLKDSKGLDVQFDIKTDDEQILIAPLLLIPFVENAFKHSQIEDLKKGFIHIQLESNTRTFSFKVTNSVPKTNYSKDQVGGIGLVNVRKRLSLLYPERHELLIQSNRDEFFTHLKLKL